ncbi:hypothetical protein ACP70R_031245 [Stipagrostis hirtigluma subsp. patula]
MEGVATSHEPPPTEGVARGGKRAREGVQLFGARLIKPEDQEDGEPAEAAPKGGGAPSESPAAMATEAVLVGKNWLRCSLCSLPLKRPIYLCEAGHLACCSCRVKLPDNACRTCRDADPGAAGAYAHCPGLDAFYADARVPCTYAEYGCRRFVPYFEAADHGGACEHAPCFCPEPGCFLVSAPRALGAHLAVDHSWPHGEVPYGVAFQLAVPVPPAPARHLRLLRGGEDASLFMMAAAALGDGDGAAVSLTHVRANAPVHPRFTCTLYASAPPEAAGLEGGYYFATVPVRSSALADGAGVAPEKGLFFAVPGEMLRACEASGGRELLLSVRIDRSFGPEPPAYDDH